jgi:hypothetical protein
MSRDKQDSVILGKSMKPVSSPRSLTMTVLILVAVTFLAGTLRTFDSARAVALNTPTAPTLNQTGSDATLTPTAEPTQVQKPVLVSADTTGIIALAIVIVMVVVVGALLGSSRPRKKQVP